MHDIIIYNRADGGFEAITDFSATFIAKLMAGGMSEQEATDFIIAKDIPTGATNISRIPRASYPTDHTFRDAWTLSGGAISVDMPKARGIHAERIAISQGAEIARLKVEERKERLKGNTAQANQHAANVTALEALSFSALATQIAAAPTPTALKAIWPAKVPR